jgi:transposase
MRGEVLGFERRRRWSDEDKLSIVSSVGIDGSTVTQVAHRCDVTRQQIYRWRHELKKKGLWPLGDASLAGWALSAVR